MPNRTRTLAVLIDAENVASHHVPDICDAVTEHGTPVLYRAYGAFGRPHMGVWNAFLAEHPEIEKYDSGAGGKNRADIALAYDAGRLVITLKPGGLCLVSSDSDFTPLVSDARGIGLAVFAFGRRCTPLAFRDACTRFYLIEDLRREEESIVGRAIGGSAEDWTNLAVVGFRLCEAVPAYSPGDYDGANLGEFIKQCDGFEVRRRGTTMEVRRRPDH